MLVGTTKKYNLPRMSVHKMRLLNALAFLFLLCLFVAGCGGTGEVATASYEASSDRMTYETRSYTVSTVSGSNYASSKSIKMKAVARCLGQGCTPDQIQLVFSTAGNQELGFSSMNGELVADGNRTAWTGGEARNNLGSVTNDQIFDIRGSFATVDLTLDRFRIIATASSVEGSIGGKSLDIDSGVQAGFQKMLQKIPQG